MSLLGLANGAARFSASTIVGCDRWWSRNGRQRGCERLWLIGCPWMPRTKDERRLVQARSALRAAPDVPVST